MGFAGIHEIVFATRPLARPLLQVLGIVSVVVLVVFGLASPSASAQTMFDCQTVAKPRERLACYDKLSPPIAANARRAPATASDLDREDARMKRLLRPICRNC